MNKRIPKFRSLEEERAFWDTHSVTDFMDELKPAKIEFARPKKRLVSIRLESAQIDSLKAIASRKGLGYLTLIRFWIAEHLSREGRRTHTTHA